MEKNLIIRSGETILKGNNRRFFEEKLMKSIRRVLKPLGFNDFNLKYNSIYVPFTGQNEVKAINALMHVFGIDLVSIATQIPAEMEQIKTTALTELKNSVETTGAKTFKVQTKRTD